MLTQVVGAVKERGNLQETASIIEEFYGAAGAGRLPWLVRLLENPAAGTADILSNISGFYLECNEDEETSIQLSFRGPKGTPYADKVFELDVDIHESYPLVPLECYLAQ